VQQRGLARPGRADDADQFAMRDGEAHLAQRGHRWLTRVGLGHPVDLQDGVHVLLAGIGRGPELWAVGIDPEMATPCAE
jgi:hypothetical protein